MRCESELETLIHHQPPHPEGPKWRGGEGTCPKWSIERGRERRHGGARLAPRARPLTSRGRGGKHRIEYCQILSRLNRDFSSDVMACRTCVCHVLYHVNLPGHQHRVHLAPAWQYVMWTDMNSEAVLHDIHQQHVRFSPLLPHPIRFVNPNAGS